MLERFNLTHMAEEYAGTLSGGQRKLLEMARALMASPRLILLDEPMAGVNPALRQHLLDHIRDLRDEGMTVLYVEHEMDVVMDISEWVVHGGRRDHRRGRSRLDRHQRRRDRRVPRPAPGRGLTVNTVHAVLWSFGVLAVAHWLWALSDARRRPSPSGNGPVCPGDPGSWR